MELSFFQIDAFAERPFTGNPAAVVLLGSEWLPDETMAAIAAEQNLSETAFVRRGGDGALGLRWFTPAVEVELCGHATLAAGWVVLQGSTHDAVSFSTRAGALVVRRVGAGALELDLPASAHHPPDPIPDGLVASLGCAPLELLRVDGSSHATYWLARYPNIDTIVSLAPDLVCLRSLRANVICTAPGQDVDFVSRFFAPGSGVDEDPVTGSAHCALAPFWAERLGRSSLRARQLSARGGHLWCEVRGDRVALRGSCVRVIEGTLYLS